MPLSHTDPDLWVRRYHPAPDAPTRLLCLPHAGGSASYYFPASRTLSPRIEVLAVQYPGRQDRRTEPCVESIDELADKVVDTVKGWTDRPLAVFGHSMGATLGSRSRCATNAQFALHVYPGGHFYLDKHASAVLDKIIATEVSV